MTIMYNNLQNYTNIEKKRIIVLYEITEGKRQLNKNMNESMYYSK